MRGLIFASVCAAAISVDALPESLAADEAWETLRFSQAFGRPARTVVTFKKGASVIEAARIAQEARDAGVSVKELRNVNAAVFDYPPHSSFENIRDHFEEILGKASVAHVEADSLVGVPSMLEFSGIVPDEVRKPMVHIDAENEKIPNDPLFGLLWGMSNIRAPEAWRSWTGTELGSVRPVVTVIDTGIDYTHPDLQQNLWVNQAELNGLPGVDDDDNGYIDDVYGWNAVGDNGDLMDEHWHGTHCAGSIGAVGDNGLGIVGVSWGPLIQGCKFLNKSGQGATSDALACINYSLATGAHISSNSWGSFTYSSAVMNAIELAAEAGQLFIAAAGNSGQNTDGIPFYPASYEVDNVVSVAALTMEDKLATFSNYGAMTVDIAAPGVTIASTFPGGRYAYASGTSMAAPHVSGAAALVLSQNPALDYRTIIELLRETAAVVDDAEKLNWGGKVDVGTLLSVAGGVEPAADLATVVGPSTATCSEICNMTGLSCMDAETSDIHRNLSSCLAAVEALPVRAYWAGGSVDAAPSYYPAGCYAVHGFSINVININTVGGSGCEARPADVAKSNRVCVCQ